MKLSNNSYSKIKAKYDELESQVKELDAYNKELFIAEQEQYEKVKELKKEQRILMKGTEVLGIESQQNKEIVEKIRDYISKNQQYESDRRDFGDVLNELKPLTLQKESNPTKENPIIVHLDGFSYNYKFMDEGKLYEFVYDGTKMAIKKDGENMVV